jgi:gamma-glutamyl-gamma-aminobutyrate hydrolase PuuD
MFRNATKLFVSFGLGYTAHTVMEQLDNKENHYEYALNQNEKNEFKQLKNQDIKPAIVALYDPEDGTAFADLAIQHFQNKDIDVIPVSSKEGLNHPIIAEGKYNGIYLPGGPNVPVHDHENPRKKFEGQLIEIAEKKDIPLIGICRGQQTLGHHLGLEVSDLPSDEACNEPHYDNFDRIYHETNNPNFNNKVVAQQGSLLHSALQSKFKTYGENPIEYPVVCLHHQHVVETPKDKKLKISGRGKYDHIVESVEKKTGKYTSIGLQHHPESIIDFSKEMRKQFKADADEQLNEATSNANYIDPELTLAPQMERLVTLHKQLKRSKGEMAARAELGLFTNQVKKQFLEKKCDVQFEMKK